MSDEKRYDVFHRTWWREAEPLDGRWPNNLVPCAGEKHYLAHGLTGAEARAMCKEWNDEHDPGRYSDKAEFRFSESM